VPAPDATDRVPFAYVILRVVPSVERGEQINAGVVLFCRQRRFLGVRWELDGARLAALTCGDPARAVASGLELGAHLGALARVAEGDMDAGPIAALDQSERFGWLAAPSSTVVQPSEAHAGLCVDPLRTLEALFARLVSAR
jgi:hypothetical protein